MPDLAIISGGQTGVDQSAWRAAAAFRVPTAGLMPLGFLTEDGPRPEFAGSIVRSDFPSSKRNTRGSDRNAMA